MKFHKKRNITQVIWWQIFLFVSKMWISWNCVWIGLFLFHLLTEMWKQHWLVSHFYHFVAFWMCVCICFALCVISGSCSKQLWILVSAERGEAARLSVWVCLLCIASFSLSISKILKNINALPSSFVLFIWERLSLLQIFWMIWPNQIFLDVQIQSLFYFRWRLWVILLK